MIWWELYSVVLLKSSLKNFLPKPVFTWLTEAWAKQVPRSHRGDQSLCWTVAGEATRKRWETVRKIKSSRPFVEKIRRFGFLVCCSCPSLKPIWWKGFGGVGLGAGSLRGSRGFVEARSSRESKTAGWTTSCDFATWIKRCFETENQIILESSNLIWKRNLGLSHSFGIEILEDVSSVSHQIRESWVRVHPHAACSQDVFVGAGWCVGCQSKARGKRHVEISRER